MFRIIRIILLSVIAIAAAPIFVTPANANVVKLICAAPTGAVWLITINYSAQTLGADVVDEAGNVTIMAYHKMRANITDANVSATLTMPGGYGRFTVNRYSGVLRTEFDFGAGYNNQYTKRCQPYESGRQIF
jgi:hypothetical protein